MMKLIKRALAGCFFAGVLLGGTGKAATDAIMLVDGTRLDCEVLFTHPNAPCLVLRASDNSWVQSFPTALVHAVAKNGKPTVLNPRRDTTPEEKATLEADGLTATAVGKGQLAKYATETWERKPLIVWANPGESGNAMEGSSWLDETGKPLEESPWKESKGGKTGGMDSKGGVFDGDILLPGAAEHYEAIQPGNRDHLNSQVLRHLTVEENASYRIRYTIQGNLWVKKGAELGEGTQTGGLGSGETNKHTVARFSYADTEKENAWASVHEISHWVYIDTGERGSLEIVGLCGGASDRLTFARGTLVMSEDSYIGNGNRGSFYTEEGTTTILLNGARVGNPDPMVTNDRGTYGIGGTLMFGTPEHPITRDLDFGGAYFMLENLNPDAKPSQRTAGASFVLGETGKMVVHSADPAKARVLFQPRSKDLPVSQYVVDRKTGLWDFVKKGAPAAKEFWDSDVTPDGVTAVFLGETDFNGVHFDGFYEGGIIVKKGDRSRWKNVTFGGNNLADPEKIFREP